MMSRRVTIGLAAALVVTNAMWLYQMIDTAATSEHYSAEFRSERETAEMLRSLVAEYPRGADAASAFQAMRARYPDQVTKLHGDTVELGGLKFIHGDGRLHRVIPF